ncbi:hypothetical protein EF910_06655 [Streptomyces sp. WAC07149]|uniref:hypothetical protein n=1 Tax=Streptomyces sp. WAC07149 TaxID=2487425 RepID=UPI000F7B5355|nr:hypothetical protein [Streptomyces sp. WAC07149]RST07357.1 hypothetical protein EF910_06655 [Streptomyces sp. WAC07149]
MPAGEDGLLVLIRGSGLVVEAVRGDVPGPSVDAAWRAMAGFGVEPAAVFPLGADRAGVHGLWLEHARQAGVVDDEGFLVTAVVTGSSEVGWVRVRLGGSADVARLVDGQGRIEFIARSRDGHRICGITAEEYEHWGVGLELP